MANTKTITDRNLRKSAKRAARRRLVALDVALSPKQRRALRRARAEKNIGIKQFLGSQKG
ncbi:MAG: hypothetical protein KC502_16210 [Myxococcales bacterium]|nr:hypothetical protein [Myxococcales bacterium]